MHRPLMNIDRVVSLGAVLLVLGWLGCSGGSTGVCGNGIVESGEECDCGTDVNDLPGGCYQVNGGDNASCTLSCQLREVQFTKIIIRWFINGESFLVPNQSFDTCNDVNATWVHVLLEGDSGYSAENPDVYCTNQQVEFLDEPTAEPMWPGRYTAWVELQTAEATPLTPFQMVEFDVFQGVDNEVLVDFPVEEFYDYENMRGELGIRPYWGADLVGCSSASPAVVDRSYVVSQDGSALAGFPADGACLDQTTFFEDLLPGDYELRIEGYDAVSDLQYCGLFDVKVGVGIQPSYSLTVPTYDASAGCGL